MKHQLLSSVAEHGILSEPVRTCDGEQCYSDLTSGELQLSHVKPVAKDPTARVKARLKLTALSFYSHSAPGGANLNSREVK
jgi:hypothetical protein